jgi:hypothetical protein
MFLWNPLENRWRPIDHDRKLTAEQREKIDRRKALIAELVTEIEVGGDSVLAMYSGLLARALCSSDEELVRGCGDRVAALSAQDKIKREPRAA